MVEADLKQWLHRDDQPGDFYRLVGQPRLCRDRGLLRDCFEAASEYLFQCQNHRDKRVRDRARSFYRQVAEARRIVSDEHRWEDYDQNLIAQLQQLFRKNPTFSGESCNVDDLRRWLALVQQVDSGRVEELILAWTTDSEEMETASAAARTQVISPPHRNVARDVTGSSENADLEDAPVEFDAYHFTSSKTPPPIPERKKDVPPPPTKSLRVPPPVPAKEPSEVRPSSSRVSQPGAFQQSGPGERAADFRLWKDLQGLWIALAVFLGIFLLGVFVLLVAWASGAFEHGRSQANSSPLAISVVSNVGANSERA